MVTKLTGTLIKNFAHCRRQAYLYYYGLNFKNELVRLGEVIHKEQKPGELVFEKIKVDDIKNGILFEYKKSLSNLAGTRLQVLYYLSYFEAKGVKLKGVIKDLTYGDTVAVELSDETRQELAQTLAEIEKTLSGSTPERLKNRRLCKGCSFYDYCWVE